MWSFQSALLKCGDVSMQDRRARNIFTRKLEICESYAVTFTVCCSSLQETSTLWSCPGGFINSLCSFSQSRSRSCCCTDWTWTRSVWPHLSRKRTKWRRITSFSTVRDQVGEKNTNRLWNRSNLWGIQPHNKQQEGHWKVWMIRSPLCFWRDGRGVGELKKETIQILVLVPAGCTRHRGGLTVQDVCILTLESNRKDWRHIMWSSSITVILNLLTSSNLICQI